MECEVVGSNPPLTLTLTLPVPLPLTLTLTVLVLKQWLEQEG